ncbi:methane monooxygenase/ammonia monooxygenase subunit A [Mycolicibacterium sp. jd]|uniref:Methane monooxygenase/ammonia monooxygenase subunit A n=2 Tax=Mycobacteriaceae TaxID=1762 RepID=A0A1Y0CHI7_9MYCO|nr:MULTISPECIES: methane monooxygenase/ammonia monooxygenase subunit A [Mycobacteriaceae]ART74457.1 methane monooxygenase/ammonia monooxygenase subunit A [Mycobacterium dioxanotrophicus]MDN4517311.1 methane monooxygenase/ammonia monooxygenase subunit A [Mycolicibacterium austroafricanum]UJL30652.1 methane monooxygenase/ammonia monooxygenase subunit A [Mycolicibacterium vanbaalenii]WND56242.1 methane monooxygenase/ammonia monooxygenase subunit A [Mycolicibacterium vanbaalenii]
MTTTVAKPPTPSDPAPLGKGRRILGWRWEVLFALAFVPLVIGAFHLNQMLFVGDWSFWADWKDRQWWPLLTPALGMIIPAAVQYIAWDRLRVPIGATVCAVCLMIGQWLSRYFNFDWWANIPINYTWPETFLLAAIILDVILLVSRSYLITAVLGGLIWGFVFWYFNFVMLAPYLQAVDFHGTLLTVADTMGFHITRTQTPEYLRIIEEGHLRALVGDITIVVAFFAGMLSVATYGFGLLIGKYLAVWPIGKFFKLQTN